MLPNCLHSSHETIVFTNLSALKTKRHFQRYKIHQKVPCQPQIFWDIRCEKNCCGFPACSCNKEVLLSDKEAEARSLGYSGFLVAEENPIWKNMRKSNWIMKPRDLGENFKNIYSIWNHLVLESIRWYDCITMFSPRIFLADVGHDGNIKSSHWLSRKMKPGRKRSCSFNKCWKYVYVANNSHFKAL